MNSLLKKSTSVTVETINDMVINNTYHFEDKQFQKLFERKRKAYELQTQDYNSLIPDKSIVDFLQDVVIYDEVSDEEIRLNAIQVSDTAKILSKPYGFLQWEQGSGKTISGIAQHLYRVK